MTTQLPCPLSVEQCQQLQSMIDNIPKVQQVVADCEECGIEIPGAALSLATSLSMLQHAQRIVGKHFAPVQIPE